MNIQKIEFSTYGRKILEKLFLPRFDLDISKIYYIHDGWIDIKVEDKTYRLEKGHLYLIPNGMANVMTMNIEYVDHTYFSFYTFPRIRNTEIIDMVLAEDPLLEAHLHAMSLYVEQFPFQQPLDETQRDFILASMKNFLFLLSKKYDIKSAKDAFIEDVIDYVHSSFCMNKLSVTKLANRFHMDEGTLTRCFKRATSMTPYRYIKLLRVNRAQALIKEGNLTLEEIAHAVGYADAPTLSHAIKSCSYDYKQ